MQRLAMISAVVLAGTGLLAAQPDSQDLVRQGNDAYREERYAPARDSYEQAAERITDPGLAALNKAAALYRLGQYREAERSYEAALADAAGPRRARLLYDLGNCLLQQAHERGAPGLQLAVRHYQDCLRCEEVGPELAANARHNLELARLLLLQAPPRPEKPPEHDRDGSENRSPDRDPVPQPQKSQGGEKPDRGGRKPTNPETGQDAKTTDQPGPARGTSLPPVPDKGDLMQMSAQDAEEHLLRATEKILHERREHRFRSAKVPASGVKDW